MPPKNREFICQVNGFCFYRPSKNAQTILVEHDNHPGFSASKNLPKHLRGSIDEYSTEELKEELHKAFYADAIEEIEK